MKNLFRSSIRKRRPGVTLVELLVVLGIISLLTGIALPNLKQSLREHRVTRAAGTVQAFIEDARARAIAQGGGAGIVIDRIGSAAPIESVQAVRLRIAMTPSPYRGDGGDVKGQLMVFRAVQANPVLDSLALFFETTGPSVDNVAQLVRSAQDLAASPKREPTLINIGDVALLGAAGLPTQITRIAQATAADKSNYGVVSTETMIIVEVARLEENHNLRRYHNSDVKFTIERKPRSAIASPIQLIGGTVIDMSASGLGRYGDQFSPLAIEANHETYTSTPFLPEPAPAGDSFDYGSVWIIFGSRGEVSGIYYGSTAAGTIPTVIRQDVTGDIHLLIGRGAQMRTTDLMADPSTYKRDGTPPLYDGDSIWITIRARTGEMFTSPNRVFDPTTLILVDDDGDGQTLDDGWAKAIGAARSIAVGEDGLNQP